MRNTEPILATIEAVLRQKAWAFSHVVMGNLEGLEVPVVVLHNGDIVLLLLNEREIATTVAGDSSAVADALAGMEEAFRESGCITGVRAN
ncbi:MULTISPECIES: hypothetical protein [unclassified Chelatococcus]|uniref:hypothetical protein n=1 Tax=unclassified Chelatococcus TaxID=2638111 RepID=UPI0002F6711A|nr:MULTISPECIES: hypothetical protein [unclassified Chelatococcus]ALA16111.1 hypothetical protein AL346_00250 [Chelatococcus sp. CO-6]